MQEREEKREQELIGKYNKINEKIIDNELKGCSEKLERISNHMNNEKKWLISFFVVSCVLGIVIIWLL